MNVFKMRFHCEMYGLCFGWTMRLGLKHNRTTHTQQLTVSRTRIYYCRGKKKIRIEFVWRIGFIGFFSTIVVMMFEHRLQTAFEKDSFKCIWIHKYFKYSRKNIWIKIFNHFERNTNWNNFKKHLYAWKILFLNV